MLFVIDFLDLYVLCSLKLQFFYSFSNVSGKLRSVEERARGVGYRENREREITRKRQLEKRKRACRNVGVQQHREKLTRNTERETGRKRKKRENGKERRMGDSKQNTV